MADQGEPEPLVLVAAADLTVTVKSILEANGLSQQDADTVARAMVHADLSGHDTHGTQRLPSYLARVRAGVMSATAQPTTTHPAPAVACIDGQNAFGHVVAAAGIDAALDIAKVYGIGMAACRRSNHFGTAAWVVEKAVTQGFGALVFTNSSPAMPAWGSSQMLLGVSPLACGIPGQPPFILDMAPSVAARGKVYKAMRRGESIPAGWALDREGKPTTDPAAALEGTMLPMGGPKGSCLAIMMDVLSGVMTGAAFAGAVLSPYDPSRPAEVGHLMVVFKADLFMSSEEVSQRLELLRNTVTNSDKMDGVERIWFPGEVEEACRRKRTIEGIPFTKAEVLVLNAAAEAAGATSFFSPVAMH